MSKKLVMVDWVYQTRPVSIHSPDGPTYVWVAGLGWWEILKVFNSRELAMKFLSQSTNSK